MERKVDKSALTQFKRIKLEAIKNGDLCKLSLLFHIHVEQLQCLITAVFCSLEEYNLSVNFYVFSKKTTLLKASLIHYKFQTLFLLPGFKHNLKYMCSLVRIGEMVKNMVLLPLMVNSGNFTDFS